MNARTAKRWPQYEEYLLSGLWHVHTELADGAHSPERVVAFADDRRFPLIGIVEHVGEERTYDFESLRSRAKAAATDRRCTCVVGCETEVADVDGTLDVSDEVLDRSEVVYAAYHGTSFSQEEYVESVLAMLENPDVDVWAHPLSYPARAGFDVPERDVDRILEALVDNAVLFERNLSRPPKALSRSLRYASLPTIVGYDLHDLGAWRGPDVGQ